MFCLPRASVKWNVRFSPRHRVPQDVVAQGLVCPVSWGFLSHANRSILPVSMSSRISSRIPIRIATTTRTVPFIAIPIPSERRERKTTKSFSMPPSLARGLKTYAKSHGLSASDLVTWVCGKFLDAVEQLEGPLRRSEQRKKQVPNQPAT